MPSQPSFCTPGRPARNLSVTSLPRPALRNSAARDRQDPRCAAASCRPRRTRLSSKRACVASWILPRLWSSRSTSSHCASGVTMRQDARLSSAVPHSTAFLPPAFIATLPPMHEASAEVGSTANTRPLVLGGLHHPPGDHARRRSRIVGVRVAECPGSTTCSTRRQRLELLGVDHRARRVERDGASGVAGSAAARDDREPQLDAGPAPAPRDSSSVSGCRTTNGYSTRQSVASVTCDTRARPSNVTLSRRVMRPSVRSTRLRSCASLANSPGETVDRGARRGDQLRDARVARSVGRWRCAACRSRSADGAARRPGACAGAGCRAGRPGDTGCARRPRCRPALRRASARSGRCGARCAARRAAPSIGAPSRRMHDLAVGERRVVVRNLAQPGRFRARILRGLDRFAGCIHGSRR